MYAGQLCEESNEKQTTVGQQFVLQVNELPVLDADDFCT
jgi:hypothetical protein